MNDETHIESKISSRQISNYPPAQRAREPEGEECETAPQFIPPPNLIGMDSELITPEMLTLVELEQREIDTIVQTVPGETKNVQDIYPLSPLQEGILFHHLLNEHSDTYVLSNLFELQSHAHVRLLINALQKVINRHDILRSSVLWENLPRPVQVVYRGATLSVDELTLDRERDSIEQLKEQMRPVCQSLDLRKAPLMWLHVAADPHSARWYAVLKVHHLVCDYQSLRVVVAEAISHLENREHGLPLPVAFRNYVAQSLANARTEDAEAFFRSKLGEIDEPTAPFGLLDVHGDGSRIEEAHQELDPALAKQVRCQARRFGVSAARLFHAAWGLVVARTSGRDDVVYGTVLMAAQRRGVRAQPMVGMFVNTLPLRLRLQDVTAKELVEQTHRELGELLNYGQAALTRAQRCSGTTATAPLFTALLNCRRGVPDGEAEVATAAGIRVLAWGGAWSNYPVALTADDLGEKFVLTARTSRPIDPHRITEYAHTAVKALVEALEQAPQTPVHALSILPASERHQVTALFNATCKAYPGGKLIPELFEEQVERAPNAVAVVYEEQSLTYADLNVKANQLAHYLSEQGVQIGEYIPILMPRCLEMLIAQLAVLKSGAVYVPVDPSLPVERQAFMVRDCGALRVLAEHGVCAGLERESIQWIDCSEVAGALGDFPKDNLNLQMDTPAPAYVMYTSGSTGVPKGVIVPHRAVNRLVINNGYAQIEPTDCIAHCSNPAFDASTFEIWGALLNGASVLIVPQPIVLEPKRFAEVLSQQRVTVLWLTVGLFAQYTEALAAVFGQLRYLITGGDIVEPGTVRRVLRNSPPRHLLNAYGPTECTTFSTTYLVDAVNEDTKSIPIGRPISNTQVYILDSHLQPVPIGVTGEIYIGGAGVALGYLNRPELTAERFLTDPFSADAEARLYKSGDLGRWREDGTIDFLGRNDQQVKLRGFRVELGEIETQLARHYQVKEAVVIAREDVPGGKRLVAYITRRGESDPTVKELRAHLEGVLPKYMVPSAFVILESFPLTPNGKLDRRALPAPEVGAYACQEYEAPQGEVEETLAGIWQELLQVERVGRQDNFFGLGGHSLLVLEALFKIKQSFDCALSVRDVYKSPTLRELARRMCGGTIEDDLVNLTREAALDGEIVAKLGHRCVPAEAVMLTGGTGFVGRFLLAQLLQETDATIYCLVRAPSQHQALSRLRTTLAKWDLWRDEFEPRIVAIPGDLRLPRFGLDDLTYQVLSRNIDSIYHCGTSMNHLETYAMAKPANVESARELLKLATNEKPKLINYISTLSIFSSSAVGTTRVVDEVSRIDHERHSVSSGYSASKWVGEKIFMTAGERGIPCNIFRLGLVWADTLQGRYDELQREYRILKSCLLSGCGITNYRYAMAPTPVDYVARAVVFLAKRHHDGHGIFHISSSSQMIEGVFERCNEIADTSLELMSHYDWICEIKRLHHEGRSLPVVPLIEFAFSMGEKLFYEHQRRIRSASVRLDCARTHRELEHAGIVAPVLSDDLLRACLESIFSRDAELRELLDRKSNLIFRKREAGLRLDG